MFEAFMFKILGGFRKFFCIEGPIIWAFQEASVN